MDSAVKKNTVYYSRKMRVLGTHLPPAQTIFCSILSMVDKKQMQRQLMALSLFKTVNLGSKGEYLQQTDKQINRGQGKPDLD